MVHTEGHSALHLTTIAALFAVAYLAIGLLLLRCHLRRCGFRVVPPREAHIVVALVLLWPVGVIDGVVAGWRGWVAAGANRLLAPRPAMHGTSRRYVPSMKPPCYGTQISAQAMAENDCASCAFQVWCAGETQTLLRLAGRA